MARHEIPSIAIVGGGLGGLTLSIGLTRHGIPHKIYESASAFSEIGAGVSLGANSITALELLDPRTKEGLERCITYDEGLDAEGEGQGREDWKDVRIGEEQEYVYYLMDFFAIVCAIYR
jgi:salicylate hydroxylase